AIGMDPLDFRLHNAHEPGDIGPQGSRFTSCGFRECLSLAAGRSEFRAKRRAALSAQSGTGAIKKGIGLAATIHVGGGAKIYRSDGCGTILKLDDFAHATVISGGTDIGQGLDTVLTQIVGEELGLQPDDVTVVNNDTDVAPWDVGVHASRSTFIAGNSARRAARKARERILEEAARQSNVPAEALDLRGKHVVQADDGEVVVALDKLLRSLHFDREDGDIVITTDYYEPPSVMQDKNNRGDVSAAYTWACQAAEVEVDTETGIIRLVKVWSVHDVGRVINQFGIEGQIQGGVITGAGYALTENLIIDEGRVRNPNFADYKVFTATEIPDIDIGLIETNDPEGPYGAKGIGEAPVVPMAPAIANAVYNATGIRFTKLPLTPERVLRALKGKAETDDGY
ncbi:MAG: molybdopterin-dependent oxidoreductase, partial [Proteobacteria bacterium]|nr:molybdopterin-dependent oxidoreductase [Pseudomonadota bacterium]